MPQIFHPSMNAFSRATIFGGLFVVVALGWVAYELQASPWATDQGIVRDQPVPFSHEHHVRGLGIDCRYCHGSVETSSYAGMPSTETCMTCHSKVWTNAALLQPIRTSWQNDLPVRDDAGVVGWTRVHNLPDFVYFNHAIHVNKGIGCATCHGPADTMPLMYKSASLQMEWCLKCHRDPENFVRPRDKVFDMDWVPPENQKDQGANLVAEYHIPTNGHLTTCYVCHR